tara:strand:+ start:29535 stop:30878 length:1344 start_codon:yes stop_codon:yes gene_type:complete
VSLKISRILHAGYVFECESTQILFDPIFENPFSRNCHAFPNVKFDVNQIKNMRPDAVFISHYHDDHCSMESLNLIDRSTSIYIFCIHKEMLDLIRSLGFTEVHSVQLNEPIVIGSLQVIPRRALDEDIDCIFHIKGGGLNILNVVDSWIDQDTLQLLKENGPWDMVLWPFQTMREIEVLSPSRFLSLNTEFPPEWLDQIKELSPRMIVPSSCQFIHEPWSWYNQAFFPITYRRFEEVMKIVIPHADVIRLNPGVSITMASSYFHMSSPLSWIQPQGSQDVDYRFQEPSQAPSTSIVASKISPLTNKEADRVYGFCQEDLLDRYSALFIDEGSFFQKPRLWRLNLYDHLGQVRQFNYMLQGNMIALMEKGDGPIHWLTEVPVTKVYNALVLGESLTSMYIRINDTRFDEETEDALKGVDFLEDPLVRCLFDGVFGAYQKAQLMKIKEN